AESKTEQVMLDARFEGEPRIGSAERSSRQVGFEADGDERPHDDAGSGRERFGCLRNPRPRRVNEGKGLDERLARDAVDFDTATDVRREPRVRDELAGLHGGETRRA